MSQFFINTSSTATERFDMGRFMAFTDSFDPLTSAFLDQVKVIPPAGTYTVQGEDGRPDLLSKAIYNDFQYWWILLLYNGRIDFRAFKTGDVVSFPAIAALEDLYFSLKAQQQAVAKRA